MIRIIVIVFIVLILLLVCIMGQCAATSAATQCYNGGAEDSALVSIEWPKSDCLSNETIIECKQVIKALIQKTRWFGPATSEQRAELKRIADRIGNKLTASQLTAIFNMEMAMLTQNSGVKALRHGADILEASVKGESILAISQRLNIPPLAVLRQVLLESGHSVGVVRKMIIKPSRLPASLAAQLPAILEADLSSRVNAERIRERSQNFEMMLGKYLHSHGVSFKTENEIRADTDFVITPDFLLDQPIKINGSVVNWIEAKDYPFYGSQLVSKTIELQTAKYVAKFGPGAVVFSGGIMCKTPNNNALYLSGAHLA